MATVTSIASGAWVADAATVWDTGAVPAAGDEVVISSGHTITYDCGDANTQYLTVTVNGVLQFPINASSKLEFNNSTQSVSGLIIGASGILRTGTTTGDVLPDDYTLEIFFQNPSSGTSKFRMTDGGIISLNGDDSLYGASPIAVLNADWSSGTTLYITGDFSSKWKADQWIVIERHASSRVANCHQTEVQAFQISSVGSYDSGNNRTPITVTGSPGTTYYSGGYVANITRNIDISIEATSYANWNHNSVTENLNCDIANYTAGNVNFNNCMFRGWNQLVRMSSGCGYYVDHVDCSFINNGYVSTYAIACRYTDCIFYSNMRLGYNNNNDVWYEGCYFMGIRYGHMYGRSFSINCVYLAIETVYQNTDHYSAGCFYRQIVQLFSGASEATIFDGEAHEIDKLFVATNANYGGGNIYHGTIDNVNRLNENCGPNVFMGAATNVATPAYTTGVSEMSFVMENAVLESTERAFRQYSAQGDLLPLISGETHWQTPPSGNSWILELTPGSRINDYQPFVYSRVRPLAAYIGTTGSHTISFDIYPSGWTTALSNEDIYIEVLYYDGTGTSRALALTASGTFSNGGWRDLTVTFSAGRTGIVYFNIYLKRYESGAYILIDPVWGVS